MCMLCTMYMYSLLHSAVYSVIVFIKQSNATIIIALYKDQGSMVAVKNKTKLMLPIREEINVILE